MKTIYKKFALLIAGLFTLLTAFAQADAPGQVWQWSIPVKGGLNNQGQPWAYLWIPEDCSKVRGLILVQNNMEELSIVENQQFRDSMQSIGFGEIWIAPAFRPYFNIQEGDKELLLQILKDLADRSGYDEINNVPLVPIGHSAMANFPFAVMAGCPERALCGISVSGMFPYEFGNSVGMNTQCGRTIDYIPFLASISEWEGCGDPGNSTMNYAFNKRSFYNKTPISNLPGAGEFHFATTQKKTNFIAYYIKKAAYYRLKKDATATTLATLKPIDPLTTGWLVDRWQKNMRPRYPAAVPSSFWGRKSEIGSAGEENFWCFDKDMARRIEEYQSAYFRKTPCLIAYNQSTTPGVVGSAVAQTNNHVQCTLKFIPLNDSLDFELSSSFLDEIPAVSGRCVNFMSTTDTVTGNLIYPAVGTIIGHPSNNSLSVIDRECNMFSKLRKDPITGITTFRMTLDRGLPSAASNYQQFAIFSVAHPGDATYKASVLQADMSIPVRNTTGLTQSITFPQIADVSNILNPVLLNATSSLGMPVQYYVQEGPVKIVNNKLVFTTIPQSAKLPIKVTVVAWQWGRNADLAARVTSATYPGQQIQTAKPVSNTFYITDRLTPKLDLSLTAVPVNNVQIHVSCLSLSELNTERFELQRSFDNLNWTTLKSVSANKVPSAYSFDDNAPGQGNNYYRMKLVSADGTFAFSNVVIGVITAVSNELLKDGIEIIKVNDVMKTRGFVSGTELQISIFDTSGRLMSRSSRIVPLNGVVETTLPVMAKGVYNFQVVSENINKSIQFIK
jgi:hypothetical protein